MLHNLFLAQYLGDTSLSVLRWVLTLALLYLVPVTLACWIGPEPHNLARGMRLLWALLLVVALEVLTWV